MASPISIKEYKPVIEVFPTKKMPALDDFTDGIFQDIPEIDNQVLYSFPEITIRENTFKFIL